MANKRSTPLQVLQPQFPIDEILDEIRKCLEKNWTGMGFKTVEFEDIFSSLSGHSNCIFLSSNTAGLHLTLEVLKERNGWSEKSEVLTTSLTFVSTNTSIIQTGLKPVFCDVDKSLNLDINSIKASINLNTVAIIFVGLGGNTANLRAIEKVAKEYGLALIIDAAHMAGSRFEVNDSVWAPASCSADATVYSFQAVKNIATADSGLVSFRDEENYMLAKRKSWLGISKDTFQRTDSLGKYNWRYSVDTMGFKYNGNSVMAAMGLVQLKYLNDQNEYRRKIFDFYKQNLNDAFQLIEHQNSNGTSQHLIQANVTNRDFYIEECQKYLINLGVHYLPNHAFAVFEKYTRSLPMTESLGDKLITLPCHPNLTIDDLGYIGEVLNSL